MAAISSHVGHHEVESQRPPEVRVDRGHSGGWEVLLPDGGIYVVCDTLGDARRHARSAAGRRHPCEIVIRDAYHRVIERQSVD